MTTEKDVVGIPPKWKVKPEDQILSLEGPSFADLCKPLSARVTPSRVLAQSDGWTKNGGSR
jgi:hypothetical protein